MELDNHILALVEPAIKPTEIEIANMGEDAGNTEKQTKVFGALEPWALCNGTQIGPSTLEEFKLMLSGPVPKCSITFANDVFGVESFPRDGDHFTILLNSKHQETFKSIHMDFDITDVRTSSASGPSEAVSEVTLTGIAKIPRLYAEDCQSYDADTSLSHIEKVVRDLEIGLASNVESTDDNQSRIQAYTTYYDFIQSMIDECYISEESFTKWSIDAYYYLNFIDVNKIINSKNPKIDEVMTVLTSFAATTADARSADDDADTADNIQVPLVITNQRDLVGLSCYAESYEIINNSAKVSNKAGYARDIQIYDNNSEKGERLQEFKVEPLTSDEMRDIEEPLRGNRNDERYKTQVKHKYMGRQNAGEDGLGNTHKNLMYTQIFNKQNQMELEKMKLKVTLDGFNPSIYKYCKIPVMMYLYDGAEIEAAQHGDFKRDEAGFTERPMQAGKAEDSDSQDITQKVDNFLTGFYVVENLDYTYDTDEGMKTICTLIRREWPTRVKNITG